VYPHHAIRRIVARFCDSVGTHIGKLVGVGYRLPLFSLRLLVLALVFRSRERFDVLGAIVPRDSVLVVDSLAGDGIISVFRNGKYILRGVRLRFGIPGPYLRYVVVYNCVRMYQTVL